MDRQEAIRFYFSFRSPYAWLAAEQLEAQLGDIGVPIERLPVYPTPGLFPNDPMTTPHKAAYIVQDVPRLARELGLSLRFPSAFEPEWSISHAAFLGAQRHGDGHAFMLEAFRCRFSEGRDLGDDAVIADAARRAELDPDEIVAAAHDDGLRARAEAGWREAIDRDHIFGVPSFVYAKKLYWGQDRIRFLRHAVARKSPATPGP